MALDTKLTKVVSGYLPPEKGPFECEHCIYFKSCLLYTSPSPRDS